MLGPYLLTREQHRRECMVHVVHDMPAGEHVETEAVQVGRHLQEADGDEE